MTVFLLVGFLFLLGIGGVACLYFAGIAWIGWREQKQIVQKEREWWRQLEKQKEKLGEAK